VARVRVQVVQRERERQRTTSNNKKEGKTLLSSSNKVLGIVEACDVETYIEFSGH
jgi:hypothetical protein